MRYFVTGATGFLGGHVVAALLAAGREVTALVPSRDVAAEAEASGVRPRLGSITDLDSLRRGMRGVDGVFHVAGHRLGIADGATAQAINFDGTRNVIGAARLERVPRVVCTSTLAVFSDTGGALIDETYRYRGRHLTDYDRMKATVFNEVLLPEIEAGSPVNVVFPGAIYGPGDASRMASVIERHLRGRVWLVAAQSAYCWAHVEDSAQGHLLAMERGAPGESYIIGGPPMAVRDVLARIGDAAGRHRLPVSMPPWLTAPAAAVLGAASRVVPPLRPIAERARLARGVTYLGSDARARRELGWSTRPIDDGLAETVEWLLRDMVRSGFN